MRIRVVVVVGLLAGGAYACADSRAVVGVEPGSDGGVGATTDGSGGADALGFVGGDGGDNASSVGCSDDLQSVIEPNGVVHACPPDQGCQAGTCVPACEAAASNHGSIGCDFVVPTPAYFATPPCFAVFLSNAWPKAAKISVARAGTTYDVTTFARIPSTSPDATSWPTVGPTGLPPNQVAVLFLSSDPNASNLSGTLDNCPVPDAINSSTAVTQDLGSTTGIGQAFHITTDVPVTGYDILPYGGGRVYSAGADLLLPTSAWGKSYVAIQPTNNFHVEDGMPWGQIVAMQDNTKVTMVPTVDLPTGSGVAAAPKNQVSTFTLDAGEFIQWQLPRGSTLDMSGSVIASDNPIAFIGGNGFLSLRSATSVSAGGGESELGLVPPVSALASAYALSPFTTRRPDQQAESILYRVAGTVSGTTLTYDPPVPGAPAALGPGDVFQFESTSAFVVKSQDDKHPLYVAQLMPGCKVTSYDPTDLKSCQGDEEQNAVVPPAQWLSKYVFFTDPTYPTTNLVLTRMKTSAGFKDVEVDCVGDVTGWQSIGSSGEYEYADVDLIRAGVPNVSCNNGRHVAKSDGPFGLVVWGLNQAASYGYPAGGNFRSINTVIVPPVPK